VSFYRLQVAEIAGNQVINGFGSRDYSIDPGSVGGGEDGLRIAWQTVGGGGAAALGSLRISGNLDSSQNSVGGPIRPHLHPSLANNTRNRMGRRTSDGGPYVQGYRQFMEKRNLQLPEIKSNSNMKRSDSSVSSTSSVKMLLMEKQLEKQAYGGLPRSRKEWLQQVCGWGLLSIKSFRSFFFFFFFFFFFSLSNCHLMY